MRFYEKRHAAQSTRHPLSKRPTGGLALFPLCILLKGPKCPSRSTERVELCRNRLPIYLASRERESVMYIHVGLEFIGERASAISMANSTGSKLDAIPTAASSCSEPDGEPINTKLPQSAGSPSPATRHKMLVHSFVAKDSFDLAGSDRETDKDGSVTEDSRTRRPLANSIRRRALQSSTSGHSEQAQQQQQPQQQQPMNSSPGTTPRRLSIELCRLVDAGYLCCDWKIKKRDADAVSTLFLLAS